MKIRTLITTYLLLLVGCIQAQTVFENNFLDKTMRLDLVLAGNKDAQSAYLLNIKQEPFWGGSKTNLIDAFGYGEYRFSLYDIKTDQLMYSRGFCTLFEEWRTTEEAKSLSKAFNQPLVFPYPINTVKFVLEERLKDGSYALLTSFLINPDDTNIQKGNVPDYEVVEIINNGPSSQNVDFTFVAEGYTINEMEKFKRDVARIAESIISQEPYVQFKDKINFWAVCSPSVDSGTDDPRKNQWANTAVNSTLNTFYIDRYLETSDAIAVRDIAACAPYDHICVLVNSDKYGGGGIYNHFSVGTSDHPMAGQVMLHEIGHGFAGLGDEYYTSDVAYQNFFDLTVEPWQPNLTTMVNFSSKWKHLVKEDVPIPTPDSRKYRDVTGVFEGGGYVKRGVYRPAINCRMKSNQANGFCEACQEAIVEMINFVTD